MDGNAQSVTIKLRILEKSMSKTKTYWKGYSEKHQTPDFVSSSNKEFQEEIPVGEFCLVIKLLI